MTLILWSGGCDSTLVLWDLLQEQDKCSEPINTISISHPQVWAINEQLRARKEILKHLRGKGYRINDSEVQIIHDGFNQIKAGGAQQAALWLSMGVVYLGPNEDLYVGYVRGDDFWHYRQDYDWGFTYLRHLSNRTGKWIAPLEWVKKHEVIERLKKADLYRLVWWCEDPKNHKPCGKCPSCVMHGRGLRSAKAK